MELLNYMIQHANKTNEDSLSSRRVHGTWYMIQYMIIS